MVNERLRRRRAVAAPARRGWRARAASRCLEAGAVTRPAGASTSSSAAPRPAHHADDERADDERADDERAKDQRARDGGARDERARGGGVAAERDREGRDGHGRGARGGERFWRARAWTAGRGHGCRAAARCARDASPCERASHVFTGRSRGCAVIHPSCSRSCSSRSCSSIRSAGYRSASGRAASDQPVGRPTGWRPAGDRLATGRRPAGCVAAEARTSARRTGPRRPSVGALIYNSRCGSAIGERTPDMAGSGMSGAMLACAFRPCRQVCRQGRNDLTCRPASGRRSGCRGS